MSDEPTSAATAGDSDQPASTNGLIDRLRNRGAELAKGRRLVLPLPGWDDLGSDGRGLWARFTPITRKSQLEFSQTPDEAGVERDFIAPQIAAACEEILIGKMVDGKLVTAPLADEPDVKAAVEVWGGPLGFDAPLGQILGVGGDNPPAVVKRMLIRGQDDVALYAVWSELLAWSGTVVTQGVEVAAGE